MKGKITLSEGRWIAGRDLERAAEDAWRILTDTTLWPLWGPSVAAVECRTRFITAASRGRVRTSLGFRLPFLITHYRHGEFWSWRIGNFEATGHRVVPLEHTRCRVEFDMPWWAAPYILICLVALNRIAELP